MQGYIDIHNHMLPGVDDGARSMEQSIQMMALAYQEGIRHIILTPHFIPGQDWDEAKTELAYRALCAEAAARYPDLRLYRGNELLCQSGFSAELLHGRCRCVGGRYVLVEFMPDVSWSTMLKNMEIMQGHGFSPILAHAERYDCLRKKPTLVRELQKYDIMVQVNTDTITGENGFGAKRFASKLLQGQLIDFIGTDCHSVHRRPPRYRACAELLRKKLPEDYAEDILIHNPRTLLRLFDSIER